MATRESASVGMGILGGLASVASLGDSVTAPDVLIGAAVCWVITYGIGTMIMKSQTPAPSNTTESQRSRVSLPSGPNQKVEVTVELQDFLNSLKPAPTGEDGWYRDPANLFKLRYSHQGRWTLAVSDSDTELEKSAALTQFLPHLQKQPDQINSRMNAPVSEQAGVSENSRQAEKDAASIGQRVEHLERLAKLRENQMISEEEFQLLKKQII